MKTGDLVRRTVPLPGLDRIYGIIIKAWAPADEAVCEVLWPDGGITMPFKKNLVVVTNESR